METIMDMENVERETSQETFEENTAPAQNGENETSVDVLAELRREMEQALDARFQQMMDETLRISRMTEEERESYASTRRENDLSERERRLISRELRADALELLAQRGLPGELADMMSYEKREDMLAGVDRVERLFRQAVQAGVEARMRGATPAAGASAQGSGMEPLNDEDYYRMNYAAH